MAYRGEDPAPVLPAAVRAWLAGWLCRVLGFAVLTSCTAAGVSLLSWTKGAPRNLLGPPGATLSELMMQMLGLAGVFVLLPPLFWGLQLVTASRLDGLRAKLMLAPAAILFLAGAMSSVPSAAAWPLPHGYGGLLGDLGHGLLTGLLGHVNPERSAAAAGLFYFAAGLLVLMSSIGLTQRDLKLICQAGPQLGLTGLGGWCRRLGSIAYTRGERIFTRPPEPRGGLVREPPLAPVEPRRPPIVEDLLDEPPPIAEDGEIPGLGDIAERFAPPGAEARAERAPPAIDPEVTSVIGPPPSGWRRPPPSLLKRAPVARSGGDISQSALRGQARLLEDVLKDFGIKGEIKNIHPGPVVTLFELEPARGVKSARVIGLADDIARSMSAASARVAVVAGRNAIGIELPNPRREKVQLRELIETEAFRDTRAALPLALGKDIAGAPVFADLAAMPHLLVAGTTGAGKSVGVNAMVLSLLYRLSPEDCRFLMIDPKMLELSVYNGIPHLLCPVVTDPQQAVAALDWVVREMDERYRRMSRQAVRNIEAFNERARRAQKRAGLSTAVVREADLVPMPHIVVVVDEFADLMMTAGKNIEVAVQRLAQKARAAGIHLIMATQRPSVDVITGTIKANFPTRISFKVASKFDSRTILNEQGAEQLLGQGDMLFSGGGGRIMRVHGTFVSDEEVEGVATYLRQQGAPRYVAGITDVAADGDLADAPARLGRDDLYDRAVALVLRDGRPSITYLERKLGIGYRRAANLIERMETEGVISTAGSNGRRQVLDEDGGDAPYRGR